jgi:hypothetical protein
MLLLNRAFLQKDYESNLNFAESDWGARLLPDQGLTIAPNIDPGI